MDAATMMGSGLTGAGQIITENAPILVQIVGFGLLVWFLSWVPAALRGRGASDPGGVQVYGGVWRTASVGSDTVGRRVAARGRRRAREAQAAPGGGGSDPDEFAVPWSVYGA